MSGSHSVARRDAGHPPAADLDVEPPRRDHPMTGGEAGPVRPLGGELHVRDEPVEHSDGDEDGAARLGPRLEAAGDGGSDPPSTGRQHDDVEAVDHRRDDVGPLPVVEAAGWFGDEHHPLGADAQLDRGPHPEAGHAGDGDPRAVLLHSAGDEGHRQRDRGRPRAADGAAALQRAVREQAGEGFEDGQRALLGGERHTCRLANTCTAVQRPMP